MLKNILIIFTVVFLLANSPSLAHPFRVGEKLSYTIKLMGIPAGEQILEIKDIIEEDTRSLYVLSSTVRSTGIVSLFFQMEDKIESHVDVKTLYPRFVRIKIKENSRVEDIEVKIEEGDSIKATLYDKKREREWIEKIASTPLDILSLVYWIRNQELEVGKKFDVLLLDIPGSFKEIQFEVSGVEKAYTYLGTFPAFVCKQLETDNPIRVWISQDERRLPLYIQVTTSFGLLTAILRDVQS
ncbi:DUF3108 domain-containing protein [Candidatus Aerophobetes bacterium]|nr:DUF3108 domain-containing protein [Candidatus Aerophobetes bacterium]